MKKTLVTLIITVLVLMTGITTVKAAHSYGVKITPSSANVAKGDTVSLVVSVNNLNVGANGLNTFYAIVEYDTNVFEPLASDSIKALNEWTPGPLNTSTGDMFLMKYSFQKTEGDVVELKLKAKSNAKLGSTSVTLKDIVCSNSEEDITADNTIYVLNIVEKTTNEGNNGNEGGNSGTIVDTTKPTINVSYRNVANGVQVTLTSSEELKPVADWTLSTDKKQLTRVYTSSYNGTITVEDLAGNKSDAITINAQVASGDNNNNNPGTTITDTTKPTATVSYSKSTSGVVTVTVKASEEIQPVTGWTLSTDKKTLTRQYTSNYTGTITITDLAGNKSDVISIKVDTANASGGTNSGTGSNGTNSNGGSNSNQPNKLPQAGLETYLIPSIGLIAIIGTVAFVRYKSMEY